MEALVQDPPALNGGPIFCVDYSIAGFWVRHLSLSNVFVVQSDFYNRQA